MIIKGKRMVITLIFTVALIAAIALILINNFAESSATGEPEIIAVTSHPDYAVSGDLSGLVGFADYIVTGHYEEFIDNWDMGEKYISDVYQFVIDKVNYGDVSGQIEVAIPHYQQLSTVVEGQQYEAKIDLPNYTQPEKGRKYILFLKKVEPKNIFTPASVPFQIEIDQTNKGTLKFNSNKNTEKEVLTESRKEKIVFSIEGVDIEAIDTITGKTLKDLESQITNAVRLKK
ncbi:hypothetical protein [Paenibacillus pedocola]|uniref:hypothetical protein n=1 Tax=Paenibacillus pedocola TaxID=3242193 RepID=UPI00287725A8|nr:hypothetical protein [Paenibacillus typhae]